MRASGSDHFLRILQHTLRRSVSLLEVQPRGSASARAELFLLPNRAGKLPTRHVTRFYARRNFAAGAPRSLVFFNPPTTRCSTALVPLTARFGCASLRSYLLRLRCEHSVIYRPSRAQRLAFEARLIVHALHLLVVTFAIRCHRKFTRLFATRDVIIYDIALDLSTLTFLPVTRTASSAATSGSSTSPSPTSTTSAATIRSPPSASAPAPR